MKRLVISLAALALAACGRSPANEFRSGLPTQQMVSLTDPSGTAAGLREPGTGIAVLELEGERSEFYQATYNATRAVNLSTVWILALLKAVTKHQPTTMSETEAVWGPYGGEQVDGDGLDPQPQNTWKLTVTKTGLQSFSYALDAKGASQDDTAYVTIISGSHTRAVDEQDQPREHFGDGTFLIDWDAAQALPQHDENTGTATFSYSRLSETSDVTVGVVFDGVRNNENPSDPIDAEYAYRRVPGAGGTFDFKAGVSSGDNWNIRSRWLQTGAGRADVKASGSSLPTDATINDCWDTSANGFVSIFQARSFDSSATHNYGSEGDCAFEAAEYSEL